VNLPQQPVGRLVDRGCEHSDADADHDQDGHDEHGDGVGDPPLQAARNEYRIVLATRPFPANPMETKAGLVRPGTFTRRTRIE
jgi:hypothetical protein